MRSVLIRLIVLALYASTFSYAAGEPKAFASLLAYVESHGWIMNHAEQSKLFDAERAVYESIK